MSLNPKGVNLFSKKLINSSFQANRFTQTMTKFYQFELKERTIAGCADFARSGDSNDFVAPVFDAADLCASLDSFFLAIKSYHDSYACITGIDQNDLEIKHLRPHVVEHVIQRQRQILLTRKFTHLQCAHSSGFLQTLPGFEQE